MSTATVIELEPLALPPLAAARFLGESKRTVSRLIAAGKIVARKDGVRTLVDVKSLKAYYASLPLKARYEPLAWSASTVRPKGGRRACSAIAS